ncbi:MAG: hypothetical protein K0R28_3010 [Paenibacillus sp.]|nr:hypothetical protein [Paenibacillus sp.]
MNVLLFARENEGYTTMADKDSIVQIRRDEREAVKNILGIRNYEAYEYDDYAIPAMT